MSTPIEGEFIAIQQRLFKCEALDIYHINIIAWIASYQRQGRPFFMSKAELISMFKCDKKTVYRRFKDLEDWGIVYRDGKVKRSWIHKVDVAKLDRFLRGTYLERKVPERNLSQKKGTSSDHYKNNNKTSSNKTSFREEDDILSSSSSQPITELDILDLVKDIDI